MGRTVGEREQGEHRALPGLQDCKGWTYEGWGERALEGG